MRSGIPISRDCKRDGPRAQRRSRRARRGGSEFRRHRAAEPIVQGAGNVAAAHIVAQDRLLRRRRRRRQRQRRRPKPLPVAGGDVRGAERSRKGARPRSFHSPQGDRRHADRGRTPASGRSAAAGSPGRRLSRVGRRPRREPLGRTGRRLFPDPPAVPGAVAARRVSRPASGGDASVRRRFAAQSRTRHAGGKHRPVDRLRLRPQSRLRARAAI